MSRDINNWANRLQPDDLAKLGLPRETAVLTDEGLRPPHETEMLRSPALAVSIIAPKVAAAWLSRPNSGMRPATVSFVGGGKVENDYSEPICGYGLDEDGKLIHPIDLDAVDYRIPPFEIVETGLDAVVSAIWAMEELREERAGLVSESLTEDEELERACQGLDGRLPPEGLGAEYRSCLASAGEVERLYRKIGGYPPVNGLPQEYTPVVVLDVSDGRVKAGGNALVALAGAQTEQTMTMVVILDQDKVGEPDGSDDRPLLEFLRSRSVGS
jgi:hypothetical protein